MRAVTVLSRAFLFVEVVDLHTDKEIGLSLEYCSSHLRWLKSAARTAGSLELLRMGLLVNLSIVFSA